MDQGHESGEDRYSRDDGPTGEAWEPEDEAGGAAWDDGSGEIWDDAEAPEDGTREQAAALGAADDESHTALPPKVEAWRKRSATGAVLTGFAFGLQQVFEPKQDEPAVVLETSGEPPKDLPVDADLEYGRPRHSVVNIRPWLLPGQNQAGDEAVPGQAPGETSGQAPGETSGQAAGDTPASEPDEQAQIRDQHDDPEQNGSEN